MEVHVPGGGDGDDGLPPQHPGAPNAAAQTKKVDKKPQKKRYWSRDPGAHLAKFDKLVEELNLTDIIADAKTNPEVRVATSSAVGEKRVDSTLDLFIKKVARWNWVRFCAGEDDPEVPTAADLANQSKSGLGAREIAIVLDVLHSADLLAAIKAEVKRAAITIEDA